MEQSNSMQVSRRDIVNALGFLNSVVERRSTIAALSGIKITANGHLVMEASDLDVSATVVMDYIGGIHEGLVAQGPHQLLAALRAASGDVVSIEPRTKACGFVAGALDASVGMLQGEDHPGAENVTDDAEVFSVEVGEDFIAALARLEPAISREQTRYYLNGICIKKVSEWGWRLCSTDGHRLFVADVALPGAIGALPDEAIIYAGFIRRAIRYFGKSKDPVRLTYGHRRARNAPDVTLGQSHSGPARIMMAGTVKDLPVKLSGKLIDGTYPDVTRVIPHESKYLVEVKRADLLAMFAQLCPLSDTKLRAMKMMPVEGGLRFELVTALNGASTVTVAAQHSLPDDYFIGFNGNYLADCIKALRGETVCIGLNSNLDPVVLRDPTDSEFFAIQMPLRV